jgi:hypothetical protein
MIKPIPSQDYCQDYCQDRPEIDPSFSRVLLPVELRMKSGKASLIQGGSRIATKLPIANEIHVAAF